LTVIFSSHIYGILLKILNTRGLKTEELIMHELTMLLKNDMKPALGVTEPGAIAFSVAKAKSYTHGDLVGVHVAMNSGMYKNAFTCGIPGSSKVGSMYAAALGYVAGDSDKGLESLAGVTPEDNEAAFALVDEGLVKVSMSGITSRIFIEATVETTEDKAVVTIRDSHTNIVCIAVNGEVVDMIDSLLNLFFGHPKESDDLAQIRSLAGFGGLAQMLQNDHRLGKTYSLHNPVHRSVAGDFGPLHVCQLFESNLTHFISSYIMVEIL
jgi:hypothetical protein